MVHIQEGKNIKYFKNPTIIFDFPLMCNDSLTPIKPKVRLETICINYQIKQLFFNIVLWNKILKTKYLKILK